MSAAINSLFIKYIEQPKKETKAADQTPLFMEIRNGQVIGMKKL